MPPSNTRKPWLPPEPPSSGRSATRRIVESSPAVTQPELPAMRVDSMRPSLPSWADYNEAERITEVSDLGTAAMESLRKPTTRDRALLVRLDGVHAGQVYALEQLPITVGRHPQNAVRVDDPSISRFHAKLARRDGRFVLEDLGSRNGSFASGSKASSFELTSGEVLKLGPRVSFRFTLVDHEEERLLKQLHESSTRDALTGAYNRKHFNDRMNTELAYALRHKTNVALILIDIDHFKSVNDTLGHPAGDAVLKSVAKKLQMRLRTEDLFARFGGEEFAVLLRGVHRAGAARLAERLRTTVATVPTVWQNKPVSITISAGCAALSCARTPSEAALLEVADRRLYMAKEQGRNRVISTD